MCLVGIDNEAKGCEGWKCFAVPSRHSGTRQRDSVTNIIFGLGVGGGGCVMGDGRWKKYADNAAEIFFLSKSLVFFTYPYLPYLCTQ
jgi:hypothetical protein